MVPLDKLVPISLLWPPKNPSKDCHGPFCLIDKIWFVVRPTKCGGLVVKLVNPSTLAFQSPPDAAKDAPFAHFENYTFCAEFQHHLSRNYAHNTNSGRISCVTPHSMTSMSRELFRVIQMYLWSLFLQGCRGPQHGGQSVLPLLPHLQSEILRTREKSESNSTKHALKTSAKVSQRTMRFGEGQAGWGRKN